MPSFVRCAIAAVLCWPAASMAQAPPWSADLLPRIRAAATMVPGAAPIDVHVFRFGPQAIPESEVLEGGSAKPVKATYTVFQLRFPTGWIMVDAGMDPEVAGDTTAAFRRADEKVRRALAGARSIVVTHEHHDHVGGLVRSVDLDRIVPRAILNRDQVRTLMERPNVPLIRLDSAAARRYLTIDYDLLYPLAPGVVLVKAPGHTPGSQLVYVRLAGGKELLLIGDVAWMMTGVEQRRQKAPAASESMGENLQQIAAELEWLHSLLGGPVAVINGHDDVWLSRQIRAGVLIEGLIGRAR